LANFPKVAVTKVHKLQENQYISRNMARLSNLMRLSNRRLTKAQRQQVSKSANKYRIYFAGACLAIYSVYLFATGTSAWDPLNTVSPHGRKLSGGACPDWLDGQGGGHVVGYIVMTLFLFLGLAIVCDDFFTPALEKISEVLTLSPDVAGATFLAAGSSAPEFFTSLADTFSTGNSVGVGTIVGSAMFNILVIVALAAASTKEELAIDWRPVVRDCGFYSASITLMIIFFQDGRIYWWEGLIMTLLYFVYIAFMTQNAKIFSKCEKVQVEPDPDDPKYQLGRRSSVSHHKGLFQGKEREIVLPDGTTGKMSEFIKRQSTQIFKDENKKNGGTELSDQEELLNPVVQSKDVETGDEKDTEDSASAAALAAEAGFAAAADAADAEVANAKNDDDDDDPNNYWSRFEFPADDGLFDKILWVFGLPFVVLFQLTIPDCSKTAAEKYYLLTFFMSICWIGGLCLGMVQAVTWFGCILGIDPVIMGITFLAIGTSIPDAIGSMVVARAGEADMAIANAVGSNVFDILLGLGFPWFLRGIINTTADENTCDDFYPVRKCGIELNVAILFSTVGVFFLVLIVYKWRMNNKLGITFLIMYVLYIVWTLITGLPTGAPLLDVLGSCQEPPPDAGCLADGTASNATVAA
jgi:K+-dependent Na+/Ca+ exchanger-like protein